MKKHAEMKKSLFFPKIAPPHCFHKMKISLIFLVLSLPLFSHKKKKMYLLFIVPLLLLLGVTIVSAIDGRVGGEDGNCFLFGYPSLSKKLIF